MHRLLATLVLVLGTLLSFSTALLSSSVRAQDATPGSTPATSLPLDLPAMLLLPEDIEEETFAVGPGFMWTPADIAAGQSAATGVPAEEILATLTDAGYERTYFTVLEHLAPSGPGTPTPVAVRIEMAVTEYTSEAGAAAGFAYLDGTLEALTEYEDIPLITVIGDEAEITSVPGLTSDMNTPYQGLNLSFRTGNLTADVTIKNITNAPVDQAQVEALATTMQQRMAAVVAGDTPGLSTRVARPAGSPYEEAYLVRDQVLLQRSAETEADFALRRSSVDGASDVYWFRQWLTDEAFQETWLYQFASAEEASTWLETQAEAAFVSQAFAPTDVEEVVDASAIGEASRVFGYSLVFDPETTSRGYVVFVQVGSIVARVGIHSVGDIPPSAVVELGEAQAACLEQGGCPDPVAMPAGLVGSSPAATPIAAPLATPVALDDPGLTGPTTFAAEDGTWQVTWDPATWALAAIDRGDGEVLQLASTWEPSAIVQIGTRDDYREFGGDARRCQENFETGVAAQSDIIRDFAPVTNAQGTPVSKGNATESSGTYQFVESSDDGTDLRFSAMFWCRSVVPGETVVAALATVDVSRAEQLMPDVQTLLDGVIIAPEGQE